MKHANFVVSKSRKRKENVEKSFPHLKFGEYCRKCFRLYFPRMADNKTKFGNVQNPSQKKGVRQGTGNGK